MPDVVERGSPFCLRVVRVLPVRALGRAGHALRAGASEHAIEPAVVRPCLAERVDARNSTPHPNKERNNVRFMMIVKANNDYEKGIRQIRSSWQPSGSSQLR